MLENAYFTTHTACIPTLYIEWLSKHATFFLLNLTVEKVIKKETIKVYRKWTEKKNKFNRMDTRETVTKTYDANRTKWNGGIYLVLKDSVCKQL